MECLGQMLLPATRKRPRGRTGGGGVHPGRGHRLSGSHGEHIRSFCAPAEKLGFPPRAPAYFRSMWTQAQMSGLEGTLETTSLHATATHTPGREGRVAMCWLGFVECLLPASVLCAVVTHSCCYSSNIASCRAPWLAMERH